MLHYQVFVIDIFVYTSNLLRWNNELKGSDSSDPSVTTLESVASLYRFNAHLYIILANPILTDFSLTKRSI